MHKLWDALKRHQHVVSVLLIVIVVIAACCSIGIAAGAAAAKANAAEPSMFQVVERHTYWSVVYHVDTGVMYARSTEGDFRLLVNADGTPQVWSGGEAG